MKTICYLLAIALSINLVGCNQINLPSGIGGFSFQEFNNVTLDPYNSSLTEVAPPQAIQDLSQDEAKYQPKIKILSPRSRATLQETRVEVELTVEDFPLFKDDRWGLGNHLHLTLDNEPQGEIYDIDEPFVLRNIKPGTHTIRVLAEKPWHESFKNQGALAQVTFDVLTETEQNQPVSDLPLLTYNQPTGAYTTEPILLDFYLSGLNNAQKNDWQILAKINDDSFIINQWQPIYLKGFQEGNNLIELELQDKEGQTITNAFNKTISLITLDSQPKSNEPLAQLMSDRLEYSEVIGITTPDYAAPRAIDKIEGTQEEELEVNETTASELTLEDTSPTVEASEIEPLEELEVESSSSTETDSLDETVTESITEDITENTVEEELTEEEPEPTEDDLADSTDIEEQSETSAITSEEPEQITEPEIVITPKTNSISTSAVNQKQATSTINNQSTLEAITEMPIPEETPELAATEQSETESTSDKPLTDLDVAISESDISPQTPSDYPQPRKLKVPQWWKNLVAQVQNIISKIQSFTPST